MTPTFSIILNTIETFQQNQISVKLNEGSESYCSESL